MILDIYYFQGKFLRKADQNLSVIKYSQKSFFNMIVKNLLFKLISLGSGTISFQKKSTNSKSVVNQNY